MELFIEVLNTFMLMEWAYKAHLFQQMDYQLSHFDSIFTVKAINAFT